VLVVTAAIGLGIWVTYRSETMERRFERTLNEGSLANREEIYPEAWGMFLDKPLLGWGPTINMWELGSRVGERDHPFRDTHDLLLEVLTVTGALGAIPFFAGILLCLRAAWKARHGPAGVLPLALLVFILVSNIGANLLYSKITWIVLAYALASHSQLIHARLSRRAVPVAAETDLPPQMLLYPGRHRTKFV
jgi:O-antigen ligase